MAQASAEKLQQTGPTQNKKVASAPLGSWQGYHAAFAKRNKAISLDQQMVMGERVKVSKSHTLATKRRVRVRAWRGKSWPCSKERKVPRKRGKASKENLPRRKHERVSGQSFSGGSGESLFHSKSGQT